MLTERRCPPVRLELSHDGKAEAIGDVVTLIEGVFTSPRASICARAAATTSSILIGPVPADVSKNLKPPTSFGGLTSNSDFYSPGFGHCHCGALANIEARPPPAPRPTCAYKGFLVCDYAEGHVAVAALTYSPAVEALRGATALCITERRCTIGSKVRTAQPPHSLLRRLATTLLRLLATTDSAFHHSTAQRSHSSRATAR